MVPLAGQVSEQQVEAVLRCAGIEPCAPLSDLASSLSAQLSAVAPTFAGIAFWCDATAFAAALAQAHD